MRHCLRPSPDQGSRAPAAVHTRPDLPAFSDVERLSRALPFLLDVARLEVPVPRCRCVGAWPHVPQDQVAQITSWLAILECHQERNHPERHTILENGART